MGGQDRDEGRMKEERGEVWREGETKGVDRGTDRKWEKKQE